jgi:hypothetical protein
MAGKSKRSRLALTPEEREQLQQLRDSQTFCGEKRSRHEFSGATIPGKVLPRLRVR